ncbi:MAG: tyrosine-type recombinase/integrase, partial [Desulfovibrionaceae bacterium]|nr:tyrosine-type recombinase/integrase [Desulfovibrionaceae bacterium]
RRRDTVEIGLFRIEDRRMPPAEQLFEEECIYCKPPQSQPQRDDIVAYRDELKAEHKPSTVQGYLAAVKLFFQWAAQEGLYPDIAQRIKGAKQDTAHKKDYLTTKQVSRLLESIDRSTLRGLRDYAMISVMVTTGLREISIVRADIGDIRAAGDAVALYHRGKGREDKAEYVKLAEPVEQAVRDYLRARGETDPRAPLFSSIANRNNGERMTTRSVSRVVKERLINVGLESERLTGHSLRHTAATLNLLNGGTVEETQQLLGHRNINTTLIYSHALERAKNSSEERIARAIFG